MDSADTAFADILYELSTSGIRMTRDARRDFRTVYDLSFGQYLEKMSQSHPGRDFWSEAQFHMLSDFVLRIVCAAISAKIRANTGESGSVTRDLATAEVNPSVIQVMRDQSIRSQCALVLKRLNAVLGMPDDDMEMLTPACGIFFTMTPL